MNLIYIDKISYIIQYIIVVQPKIRKGMFKKGNMQYRRLGHSGLLVPAISFGLWTNAHSSLQQNIQLIKQCLQNGINHFDTAQAYNNGGNQQQLGHIFKAINEDRSKLVISTKIWTSKDPSINSTTGTNKKHIKEGILESLKRLQMDYVDVVYAHGFDYQTPLQEICRGFHQVIQQGYSFQWATSNWDASKVYEAFEICEKYNLHKPIAAQNQYNMINRKQIEEEYRTLFEKYNYGLVAYSPLLGGYLTGKYLNQQDSNGRFNVSSTGGMTKEKLTHIYYYGVDLEKVNKSLIQLKVVAEKQFNCQLIHLAIAWVLKFKYTSTTLVGARNVEQFKDILKSMEIYKKLTPEKQGRINKILNTHPNQRMDWKTFTPGPHFRQHAE